MHWFRWYTGTATDPKFLVVARLSGQNVAAVVAVWAMLLERASDGVTQCDASKRGYITGFDSESADTLLGLEDGATEQILGALRKKNLLDGDKVTSWEKRQPKREDSSAERTRAYRERLKEKSSVTQCDAPVTHGDTRKEENREDSIKSISYSLSESPNSDHSGSCPHQRILEAYREVLPELSQPRTWRANDQTALRTRWNEKRKEGKFSTVEEGVAYFKRFFQYVSKSAFLMGKVANRDGRAFQADIRWLLKASNFDKVVEGKYHEC